MAGNIRNHSCPDLMYKSSTEI